MGKKVFRFIIQTVVIAGLYFALTYLTNKMFDGLANTLNFQLRISDALTVLPFYTPAAIPGLFIGCLGANYSMGLPTADVIYGSSATLVAAVMSYLVRKHKFMVPIPPIIIVAFTIPAVYTYILRYDETPFWNAVIGVGAGEIVACGIIGTALMLGLEDYRDKLFPDSSPGKKEDKPEDKTMTTGDKKDV